MAIILIMFGIILIIINTAAISRDKNSFKNVLKYKKQDISEVQIEIAQIRKDVAESLTELQLEIESLKKIINSNKNLTDYNNQDSYDIEKLLQGEKEIINEINTKGKTERIRELLEQGLSEDEICNRLSLGKGEILLVKGLFKN